jgi:hypothetical protein
VQLVEVDAVRAQAPKAVLHGSMHVLGSRAHSLLVQPAAELRGHRHVVAAPTERASQVLFALGAAVDVGRVEEGDADIQRGVDDGRGSAVIEAPPEIVAAQPDDRHLQGPDPSRVHRPPLSADVCRHPIVSEPKSTYRQARHLRVKLAAGLDPILASLLRVRSGDGSGHRSQSPWSP